MEKVLKYKKMELVVYGSTVNGLFDTAPDPTKLNSSDLDLTLVIEGCDKPTYKILNQVKNKISNKK